MSPFPLYQFIHDLYPPQKENKNLSKPTENQTAHHHLQNPTTLSQSKSIPLDLIQSIFPTNQSSIPSFSPLLSF